MKKEDLASVIDHTLLRPDAAAKDVEKLCREARAFGFFSACVNPVYVPLAAALLKGSGVKVTTVVGFPLGATTSAVKAAEAREAVAAGADELDMVIRLGAVKSGDDAGVFEDIRAVRDACRGRVLKVILETAYLTDEEKIRAMTAAQKAAADFVKTSTGFGPSGATVEDVRLMRRTVGAGMGVKAAGGIRTFEDAVRMLDAGATRLGTSSSLAIIGRGNA